MMSLIIGLIARIVAAMPRPAALWLGRFGGKVACHVFRYRRRLLARTLTECLPEQSGSERHIIATQMYQHLGMTLVDQFRVLVNGMEDFQPLVDVHNPDLLKEATTDDKGALLLMAHLGNWELCGFITTMTDCPSAVVVKRFRNTAVEQFVTRSRECMQVTTLSAGASFQECIQRLKHRGFVSMILDQNMIDTEGTFVDFFGKPACTTLGLALLSAVTGRPVYPIFTIRRPDYGYDLFIQHAIPPPPDRSAESLHAHTQKCTKIIEGMIREHPAQWIWLHKRWRTQPPANG